MQTLKSIALTIDALFRRWSFANRGYDSNTHQARHAAELSTQKSTPEKDTEDGSYTDDDMVELKMRLRALPESEDEPFITGEKLEETYSPSLAPPKVKKSTVAAAISNFLEEREQSTAAIARKTGCSERTVRRDLTEMQSDGKVSLVKKGVYKLPRSVKWTEADSGDCRTLKDLPSSPQCLPEGVSIVSIASIGVLLDIQRHPIRNVEQTLP